MQVSGIDDPIFGAYFMAKGSWYNACNRVNGGTSLDGVDASLVRIDEDRYILEKFVTLPYDEEFKNKIRRNLHDESAKLSNM